MGHSHLLTPGMFGWPGEAARAWSCHHTIQGDSQSLEPEASDLGSCKERGQQVGVPQEAQRPWPYMAAPWPWWPLAGSNLHTDWITFQGFKCWVEEQFTF